MKEKKSKETKRKNMKLGKKGRMNEFKKRQK